MDLTELNEHPVEVSPAEPERVLPFVSYTPQWQSYFRRVVVIALLVAGVAATFTLAPIMQTLIVTALLCFLLYIPSRILAHRTALNFPASVIVVYVVLVGTLILIVLALLPSIVNVIQSIANSISSLLVQGRDLALAATPETSTYVIPIVNIPFDLWPVLGPIKDALSGNTSAALSGVPPIDFGAVIGTITRVTGELIGALVNILSTTLLAIFLSFLVLIDLPSYQTSVARGITPIYRREIYLLTTQINRAWSGFFRGQLVIGVIIGILTWLQLTIMGVSNAIGITVIVATISLIPTIGGIIALFPMFFVPLIGGSNAAGFSEMTPIALAGLVTVVYLIWSQIIWNVVAPKILGDAVAIPLPVIILGIGVGLALGGILGAFLIVPILGTLRIVLIYVLHKLNGRDPFPGKEAPELIDLSTL